MLETISFKTWTQVIKTQSIPRVEGHSSPPALVGMGRGLRCRTQPALCSCALSLMKLSKPPGSEAVCLQLDRSSASPACLLRFLILGVGLSKSRAEGASSGSG